MTRVVAQSIPSVLTLCNLFMGMLAMVSSMEASEAGFVRAAWFIIAAAIFDVLDGKASRILKTSSDFGVQLDSIVDVCSFGIAPALLAYQYTVVHLPALHSFAFPLAFIFAASVSVRLARFNVQLVGHNKSAFTGIPSPTGAVMVASFIPFTKTDMMADVAIEPVLLLLQVAMAVLMVSNITYDTLPRTAWDTGVNKVKIGVLATFIAVAVVYPAEAFFIMAVLYSSFGIVRAGLRLVLPRHAEVLNDPAQDVMDDDDSEENEGVLA
jgi:CDP-diacylglycerol---serine O-phosphatidyltransferase